MEQANFQPYDDRFTKTISGRCKPQIVYKRRHNFRPCMYEEKELYSEIKLRKLKVLNITGPVFRYSKPSRTVQVLTLPKPLVNLRSSNRVVCLGEHT